MMISGFNNILRSVEAPQTVVKSSYKADVESQAMSIILMAQTVRITEMIYPSDNKKKRKS